MLIIIKWRPYTILSKIGAKGFDLSVFNGGVYLIVSIFDFDVINKKPHDHNVKVYDVIGNITSQTIYDVIINITTILRYWFIFCQFNWLRFVL